jgi:hypothetical protein
VEWLAATPEERVLIAERIGERGAADFAAKHGRTPILTPEQKTVRQGFDRVDRARDGRIVVTEAKGGTSPIGRGYGAEQGTVDWTIKAAEKTLTLQKTSDVERNAARIVLDAGARGNLDVEILRTPHRLGEPLATVRESLQRPTVAQRTLAGDVLRRLKLLPALADPVAVEKMNSAVEARQLGDTATPPRQPRANWTATEEAGSMFGAEGLQPARARAVPVADTVAESARPTAELAENVAHMRMPGAPCKRGAPVEPAVPTRILERAAPSRALVEVAAPATQVARSTAEVAEGTSQVAARAAGGAELTTIARTPVAASPVATAAKIAGVVGVATDVGLRASEAAAVEEDYRAGRISQHVRVESHAKNAAGCAGGWAGAWAGAKLGAAAGGAGGAFFGGVGAPIGAFFGGLGGAIGGYFAGECVGEKAAEYAVDAVQ